MIVKALPEMITMYNERVYLKKRMLKETTISKTKDPKLVKEISRCHNIQCQKRLP